MASALVAAAVVYSSALRAGYLPSSAGAQVGRSGAQSRLALFQQQSRTSMGTVDARWAGYRRLAIGQWPFERGVELGARRCAKSFYVVSVT